MIIIIKCLKTNFRTSKASLDKLYDSNRISAIIWNDCLTIAKEYSLNNNGKWINKSMLQTAIKGKYPLHSQSVQAVAHKYIFSRDSAYKATLKGYKNKYPWKMKNNFNTKWVDKAFKVLENGNIVLSNGVGREKILIKISKDISDIEIKEIELIYDRKLMISISYDDGLETMTNNNTNTCGVDLGEIHSIATYCDNEQNLIITGRKMRSIHRLRNKLLGSIQKKMSKCIKYSKRWKKLNKSKMYILSKSDNQLKDCLHKTSKEFINWCFLNSIKEIVIGDIDGVQRNTKKKKKKKTTQKLSNWNFGKLQQYIEYKAKEKGIVIKKQDESYTTQQCPCCGRRKKPSGRIYKCKCGYIAHRDIHGAYNILSKYKYKKIQYTTGFAKTTYLRIV
ncbi:MAG: RNA-guided endonuclease InsQ/TnpB family protein [Sarcina sp.]